MKTWFDNIPPEYVNDRVTQCLQAESPDEKNAAFIAYLTLITPRNVSKRSENPSIRDAKNKSFVYWLADEMKPFGKSELKDMVTKARDVIENAFGNFWWQVMVRAVNPQKQPNFPVVDDDGVFINMHMPTFITEDFSEIVREFNHLWETKPWRKTGGTAMLASETTLQLRKYLLQILQTEENDILEQFKVQFRALQPFWEESLFLTGKINEWISDPDRTIKKLARHESRTDDMNEPMRVMTLDDE